MPIVEKQERKPCEGCGYERQVLVAYMGHPEPDHPSWDRYCKVCVLQGRAKGQRKAAAKNEAAANELLAASPSPDRSGDRVMSSTHPAITEGVAYESEGHCFVVLGRVFIKTRFPGYLALTLVADPWGFYAPGETFALLKGSTKHRNARAL